MKNNFRFCPKAVYWHNTVRLIMCLFQWTVYFQTRRMMLPHKDSFSFSSMSVQKTKDITKTNSIKHPN